MPFTIDIDTGGTFTDGVYNYDGQIKTVKVSTTPHDLTVCFIENMEEAARQFGITLEELLSSTSVIRYANTIGTNTIIQKNGPRLGLIVSQGNEDRLYGQSPIWEQANHPLKTFITREMVASIQGEVGLNGEVLSNVNKEEVLEKVQHLIDLGARAIVISLQGSYHNAELEQQVKRIVKEEFPNYYLGTPSLFLASEISDYPGEDLRTNTTLINAYIHREMARSLYKAEEKIRNARYRHPLLIVHSNGGASRVAKTRAINTYHSGPASGLAGAQSVGRMMGFENIITADMGGTSLDIGLIIDDVMQYQKTPEIEGVAINQPMIRIDAIGAGGGSIARIDSSMGEKRLMVGPESAGSSPGPVCFNKGGRKVTVTDADLILGYLDPNYFLAGKIQLNYEKAAKTMERQIAKPLGISVEEAAWMIKQKVDGFISESIRQLLTNHGAVQPKNTVLFAYGGNGATHCVGFSQELPIEAIVVSPFSSVFSAYGTSTLDVVHKYIHSKSISLSEKQAAQTSIREVLQELKEKAERDMRGEGFTADQIKYELEFSIETENGNEQVIDLYQHPDRLDSILEEVWSKKEGNRIKMILMNVVAKVPHHQLEKHERTNVDVDSARKGERQAYFGPERGFISTPVYDRQKLRAGHQLHGPVLVDSTDTTTVVPPGYQLTVDTYLNIVIREESK